MSTFRDRSNESSNYKIHISGDKYSFWLKSLTEYVHTSKLVSLFVERFRKNATPSPPKPPEKSFFSCTIEEVL
ncbi:7845_t:CDS:2 [Diversispora eburnea]|uniref:7845_t:CDS:1 n=1 Tax=Diversispora eburnea TaxID=1213867 RepID=A0A9N9C8G2_9GLOM|nr:7845_t:CDS:2 [Diversispora eburnea]